MNRAKGFKGEQLESAIRKARDLYMPLNHAGLRKDYISHFILRLAYCRRHAARPATRKRELLSSRVFGVPLPIMRARPRHRHLSSGVIARAVRSEDLRRWFLQNEIELFKWRFQNNPPSDINGWLAANGLKYEAISREEAGVLAPKLKEMADARREGKGEERQEHYKVPFEEVIDLIRQRRVFVRAGFAYVPQTDLVSIVATRVRAHLSKQLSTMARLWPTIRQEESDRLAGFLEALATQYVGADDFSESKSSGLKASAGDLPMLAKRSMPPCMANMYAKLNETHHLKHKARNQLGLFLKGIGLTVEESYQVWRGAFTKDPAMSAEKWQKDYAYGIRYNYGLEGKRVNWSPHSCIKIISETGTNAAVGEHHGCPFKTFDEAQLRAQMQQMGVVRAVLAICRPPCAPHASAPTSMVGARACDATPRACAATPSHAYSARRVGRAPATRTSFSRRCAASTFR